MSYAEFEHGKAQFLRDLKSDEDVKTAGSETEIRILFDDLMMYVNLVNTASHVTETKNSKRVAALFDQVRTSPLDTDDMNLNMAPDAANHQIQELIEARRKPISPHIDDITDIAYTVGVADKKGKSKALARDIEACQQSQRNLIETGGLDLTLFSNATVEVISSLSAGNDPKVQHQAFTRLLDIGSEYMNRSFALRRLGDAEDMLIQYAYDEAVHMVKQLTKGDFSHITSMWETRALSPKRRTELSKYFLQQAEINAIRFKILSIIIHTIIEDPHPIEDTENLYTELMEKYNEWGFMKAHLAPDTSTPHED